MASGFVRLVLSLCLVFRSVTAQGIPKKINGYERGYTG